MAIPSPVCTGIRCSPVTESDRPLDVRIRIISPGFTRRRVTLLTRLQPFGVSAERSSGRHSSPVNGSSAGRMLLMRLSVRTGMAVLPSMQNGLVPKYSRSWMWRSPRRWWSARSGGSCRRYCSLLILSAFFLCDVSAFSWRFALSRASNPLPTSMRCASKTGVPTRVQTLR